MGEAAGKDILYYDGACGMCTRSTRILRAMDWFGVLEFRDSNRVPDEELPTSRETSLVGIPMRTRDGRVLVGFPAVRRAMLKTPLGAIPALVMYVPGVSHLCDALYRRIAAARTRNVACDVHSGSCER